MPLLHKSSIAHISKWRLESPSGHAHLLGYVMPLYLRTISLAPGSETVVLVVPLITFMSILLWQDSSAIN